LDPAVAPTYDLSRAVGEKNRPPTDRQVSPYTGIHRSKDAATALAPGTQTAILVWLDPEIEFFISESKFKMND
jgi:hypothetical protein